jgi:hypothetical protein
MLTLPENGAVCYIGGRSYRLDDACTRVQAAAEATVLGRNKEDELAGRCAVVSDGDLVVELLIHRTLVVGCKPKGEGLGLVRQLKLLEVGEGQVSEEAAVFAPSAPGGVGAPPKR